MAQKKLAVATKTPVSKSDFVRSLHPTMPAAKVVEKAKSAGITLTTQYVYKVRSLTKSAAKAHHTKAPKVAATKKSSPVMAPAVKVTKKVHHAPASSHDATFRKLVLELGVGRSKALLSEVERKLAGLLSRR